MSRFTIWRRRASFLRLRKSVRTDGPALISVGRLRLIRLLLPPGKTVGKTNRGRGPVRERKTKTENRARLPQSRCLLSWRHRRRFRGLCQGHPSQSLKLFGSMIRLWISLTRPLPKQSCGHLQPIGNYAGTIQIRPRSASPKSAVLAPRSQPFRPSTFPPSAQPF